MSEPRRTPIGTAWIDEDGILRHRLDFGARITEDLATETAAVLSEILGERRAPAVVDIGEIVFADRGAREVFSRLGSSAPEIATAIVVRPSLNPAPGVLAQHFSELQSDRPVRIFDDEHAAVAWARQFLPST